MIIGQRAIGARTASRHAEGPDARRPSSTVKTWLRSRPDCIIGDENDFNEIAGPLTILGLWAFSAVAATLSPEEAKAYIGETATVCGVVVSAEYERDEQSQPTLLDLGKPHPNAIFTAVIYRDHRQKFGTPEITLRGTRICVTGQIIDYQGKPEIVTTDPNQLAE